MQGNLFKLGMENSYKNWVKIIIKFLGVFENFLYNKFFSIDLPLKKFD